MIRKPAVAGSFYPAQPGKLSQLLQTMLAGARVPDKPVPKAIIAPHAAYIYSGPVAASAYARLQPAAAVIKRVILLGPCHRVGVMGLALPEAESFQTPLGKVPVDQSAISEICHLPQVVRFDETHKQEHSLEVHLPFLQEVLHDFTLLPLVVGQATAQDVAQVLDLLWGGAETLIIVSSDLSHYLDYEQAQISDARTCQAIEALAPERIQPQGACGRFPMAGLLQTAKSRGMRVETVDLRNSGDTAGPKNRVVGYGAWVFLEKPPENLRTGSSGSGLHKDASVSDPRFEAGGSDEEHKFEYATRRILQYHGEALLLIAVKSILAGLQDGKPGQLKIEKCPLALINAGASFVTLRKNGELRGCIGTARASRPLIEDVFHNAYGAAFRDPRFQGLSREELEQISMSISVLSPQVEMAVDSERQLLEKLRPGRDGLVIQDGSHRALFLPAVWEQLPDPQQFLGRLKLKAGLCEDHWSDSFRVWRFIAGEFSDARVQNPQLLWQQ